MLSRLLVLFYLLPVALSEVTILSSVQVIYDNTPKIKIRGTGFYVDSHDILLDLYSTPGINLRGGRDYIVQKDDDGLILQLLTRRRWADDGPNLILRSVTFRPNLDFQQLAAPVVLAKIIASPTVLPSNLTLYQSNSKKLYIEGNGLIGAEYVELYFNSPILSTMAYDIISKFPLQKNEIGLRLRKKFSWAGTVGPLKVVAIDTGAGPSKCNNGLGVIVAMVVTNAIYPPVLGVLDTATTQRIYHDTHIIRIHGSGFQLAYNPLLKFSNGLGGNGLNYSTTMIFSSEMTLVLEPESFWRIDMEYLPGYLTVLAVNIGDGDVPFGRGQNVATVFERPNILPNAIKIRRTRNWYLTIRGTGFPRVLGALQLEFLTPLREYVDYTLQVISRTEAKLTLLSKRAWLSTAGPLVVTRVNTIGMPGGWITLPGGGVCVANILLDNGAAPLSGIGMLSSNSIVYQSAPSKSFNIYGQGFVHGMDIIFESDLQVLRDYTLTVESPSKLKLTLLDDTKKWRKDAGPLTVKAVVVAGETTIIGLVPVVTVLITPSINESTQVVYESQTGVVEIRGHGFTDVKSTKLVIRPTSSAAYKIISVRESNIRIQLTPKYKWLPDFLSLKGSDNIIPLHVLIINTGAGDLTLNEPTVIGHIMGDMVLDTPLNDKLCINTCSYARDGVCDDSRDTNYCALGTDCQDCGPVGADNFTRAPGAMTLPDGVVVLTEFNFTRFPLTFVNFYAPWSIWYQRLEPTWKEFAKEIKKQKLPVVVANVNCVENAALCRKEKITAFPTMKLYRNTVAMLPSYTGDRDVVSLVDFIRKQLGYNKRSQPLYPVPSPSPVSTSNVARFSAVKVTDVVELQAQHFDRYLESNTYTFVHFYVAGEAWSEHLEPKWAQLAAEVGQEQLPVRVAKVNCIPNSALCSSHKIKSASSLRLFNRNVLVHDYTSTERTVPALMKVLTDQLAIDKAKKPSLRSTARTDTVDEDKGYWFLMIVVAILLLGLFTIFRRKPAHVKPHGDEKETAVSSKGASSTHSDLNRPLLVSRGHRAVKQPVRPSAVIVPPSVISSFNSQTQTPHLAKRLSELQECFQRGLISETEFQRAKQNILDKL